MKLVVVEGGKTTITEQLTASQIRETINQYQKSHVTFKTYGNRKQIIILKEK